MSVALGVRLRAAVCGALLAAATTGAAQGTTAGSATAPASIVPMAPPTAVSDSAIDAVTRELAGDLRCPVCQGLSIGDSPSGLALEMRGVIHDQLAAGKSPEEVRQYFLDKYGEWILLAPKAQGFNLLVYLLPLLALLGGAVVVWRNVRRWTAKGDGDDAMPPSPSGA